MSKWEFIRGRAFALRLVNLMVVVSTCDMEPMRKKSILKQTSPYVSAGAGVESPQGGELSTISTPETRHRKVSIQSDGPHHQHQPHSRKISAVSGHGEHHLTMEALGMAMGRRKSFAHLETLSIGSHPTDKTDKHHEGRQSKDFF